MCEGLGRSCCSWRMWGWAGTCPSARPAHEPGRTLYRRRHAPTLLAHRSSKLKHRSPRPNKPSTAAPGKTSAARAPRQETQLAVQARSKQGRRSAKPRSWIDPQRTSMRRSPRPKAQPLLHPPIGLDSNQAAEKQRTNQSSVSLIFGQNPPLY